MNERHERYVTLGSLAARAQLGSRAALEELLRLLQTPLGVHIRTIVDDGDVAADVLQDSLLLISRHLGKLNDPRWVRAWAYRIATREAIRTARRRGAHMESTLDAISESHAMPESEPIFDSDLIAELPSRIASLPIAAQVALRMHYLDEQTQAEIAEALEIPLGTVKSRIAYGLSLLRRDWASRARTAAS